MFAWKNEWKGTAAVTADVATIVLAVLTLGGTVVGFISKHKLGWFVAVAAAGLLAGLLIGGHRPRRMTGDVGSDVEPLKPSVQTPAPPKPVEPKPEVPKAEAAPAPPKASEPVSAPAPRAAPRSPRSVPRQTPAFREAYGDHEFGELLQRLYNEGDKLEKNCRAPAQQLMMGALSGKATDAIDVRAWVNRVDEALRGRPKMRAKFANSGDAPPLATVYSVSLNSSPERQELGRRLQALAAIIEAL